jgi:pyruvate/2-oxoglutarate dehydrogenase complex dihydrolipoamide dehydrogenase (E3) component
VKTFTVLMHDVDRAITDGEEEGFVKLHVREGTGKIRGATVVASHAGDLVHEISLAMNAGLDLAALALVNQPYPTQSQAIKMAAVAYVGSLRSERGLLPHGCRGDGQFVTERFGSGGRP